MGLTNVTLEDFAPIGQAQRLLVMEQKQKYIDHDGLFKRLIKAFFKEFLEAFFPELHEQINFNKITYLSEEKYTHDGNKRIVDLVVEVKWKETDTAIVVHIEPQSYQQTDFNVRMFNYFSVLYTKLNKPIIPIAIFSYDEKWEKNEFTMQFGDLKILQFNYLTLHLRKQNWRKFIQKPNPVSAALLSKMGYSEIERIQVKLEFIKILTRLKLDREKTDVLFSFFESYLKLTKEEEEKLMSEARKLENAEEVFEVTISYKEEGRKEGRKAGRKEGRIEGRKAGLKEGKMEVACKMLDEGFEIEKVAELTGLDKNEIEKLKK